MNHDVYRITFSDPSLVGCPRCATGVAEITEFHPQPSWWRRFIDAGQPYVARDHVAVSLSPCGHTLTRAEDSALSLAIRELRRW